MNDPRIFSKPADVPVTLAGFFVLLELRRFFHAHDIESWTGEKDRPAGFGSVGASCDIELEVDGGLLLTGGRA